MDVAFTMPNKLSMHNSIQGDAEKTKKKNKKQKT